METFPARERNPTQACLGKKENIFPLLTGTFSSCSGKAKSRTAKDVVRAMSSKLSSVVYGWVISSM